MENPKKIGSLVEMLFTTNFESEPEPYILTKEEEDTAIENALSGIKRNKMWKLKGLAYTEEQIAQKLSEIDWEALINRNEILQRSNSNKNYQIWQQGQRDKEKQEAEKKKQELVELWTAKNIYGLMKWTSENELKKPFILNNSNRKLISTLCFFVSRDERFQTELGYDFNKGLLIRGISGLGKTHLVRCIEKNELNPIKILSMLEVADAIKQDGEFQVNMGENKILYLDDVGTEEATVNHYGTKINFFKNFIEMIYLRNAGTGFSKMMISTNNSFDEIENKYGFRVRSRMRDMFNVIEVRGEDMRGNV